MTDIVSVRTIRGISTLILSSPSILEETKRHYNCSDANGM